MTIIYEDVLSENQLALIENEIDFLMPFLEKCNIDGSNKNNKNGFGYLLNSLLAEKIIPNIYSLGLLFKTEDNMSVLLNVYDDGGFYKKHTDNSKKTIIFFIKRKIDNFTGGELVVENDLIEYTNNIAVEFYGNQEHEVLPVKVTSGKRISLSYFYFK